MRILEQSWLTETPFDYELKKYKLLAGINKINSLVKSNHLFESLLEVEYHLEDLYRLKNKKSEIDDRLKVLKGIDLDTMSLQYDYPEDGNSMSHIYDLCDYAIEEFESLYRTIRTRWRSVSSKIKITEIPHKMPTKEKGHVFLINPNNILTYSYIKPSTLTSDWKELNLKKYDSKLSTLDDVIKYIEYISESEKNTNRFWRCDYNIEESLEQCILPVVRHDLYHKIMNI